MAPWHDCEQFHSQPDGAPSAADPPSGPLNVPANSRQVSPRGAPLACPLPIPPAWPPRAAIIGPVRPPHAVLITIYWNLAWPVRLPLPISPCVNASANPFGGFGLNRPNTTRDQTTKLGFRLAKNSGSRSLLAIKTRTGTQATSTPCSLPLRHPLTHPGLGEGEAVAANRDVHAVGVEDGHSSPVNAYPQSTEEMSVASW